jgi:hypothetical protein
VSRESLSALSLLTLLEYKMQKDYFNNDLVEQVDYFINHDKLKGMYTDYEWLDAIAKIVNQRKLTWDTVDCTTGLSYKKE